MKKILKIFYFLLITINVFSQKNISLPLVVSDSYIASNCDELHAFQSTNGKVVGNMNVIVGDMLKKLHNISTYNLKGGYKNFLKIIAK